MSERELQDACAELVEAAEHSTTAVEETLTTILSRRSDLTTELGDFTLELLLQDALPPKGGDTEDDEAVVAAALDLFRERRAADEEPEPVQNPFDDHTPLELRRLGVTLGLDKTLIVKLRDRKIAAETVPPAFVEDLAGELGVAFPVVAAHLEAPPIFHGGMRFKSNRKPRNGSKEDFTEAVRRSTLDSKEKARWLDEPEG